MIRTRKPVRPEKDRGAALILVIAFNAVMIAITTAVLTYTTQTQSQVRGELDARLAYEGARAALDDYTYRINNTVGYTKWSNLAVPCAGAATAQPDPANAAMNGWVAVPAATGNAQYRYDVDASTWCSDGTVTVKARGKSGKAIRQIIGSIRKGQSVRNTYWSDYEEIDPATIVNDPFVASGKTAAGECSRHSYEPTPTSALRPDGSRGDTPGCTTINWNSGDALNGPLHTNDGILACGYPYFAGQTTTGWSGVDATTGMRYLNNPYCTNGAYFKTQIGSQNCTQANPNGEPCPSPLETFASYDPLRAMRDSVDPVRTPSTTGRLGCLYTGPTDIRVYDSTMVVSSPDTLATTLNPGCPASGTSGPIPANRVVYVQDVPATQTTTACTVPVGGNLPQNPVGFPRPTDTTPYGCRTGDLFIRGAINQRQSVTFASAGRTVITQQPGYYIEAGATPTNSMIGLAPNTDLELYHPVTKAGLNAYDDLFSSVNCVGGHFYTRFSALVPNGAFRAQNFDKGERCQEISNVGSITNKYRGALGTTDQLHGWPKNYVYDIRLLTHSPPYFADPSSADWHQARITGN